MVAVLDYIYFRYGTFAVGGGQLFAFSVNYHTIHTYNQLSVTAFIHNHMMSSKQYNNGLT